MDQQHRGRTVVAGVDGSESALCAVRWSAAEAVVGLIATTDLQRAAELQAVQSDATSRRVPWNGSFGWE
jgi:hypothetical protein